MNKFFDYLNKACDVVFGYCFGLTLALSLFAIVLTCSFFEISANEYRTLANWKATHPAIKQLITDAMCDGRVNGFEYENIRVTIIQQDQDEIQQHAKKLLRN